MFEFLKYFWVYLVSFLLWSLCADVVLGQNCFREDFSDGSLGIFSKKCAYDMFSPFRVLKYNSTFSGPWNSKSDHFVTTANDGKYSCMAYVLPISITTRTKIKLVTYTSTETNWGTFTIIARDLDNPDFIHDGVGSQVPNLRDWETISLKFSTNALVQLEIYTVTFTEPEEFLAFDSIEVIINEAISCSD